MLNKGGNGLLHDGTRDVEHCPQLLEQAIREMKVIRFEAIGEVTKNKHLVSEMLLWDLFISLL